MRSDQYAIEVLEESTFAVAPTWTSALASAIVSIDLAAAEPPAIDDPAMKLGPVVHDQIVGLVAGGAIPLTKKADSFGTRPAAGSAPTPNAETKLLQTVFGVAATALKESTVKAGSTPTTTSVIETDNDGHAANGCFLLGAEMADGSYDVVPATYSADTDTCSCLMPLAEAPAVGAELLGGLLMQYVESPATPPTISLRAIGNGQVQNAGLHGFASRLEIAELGPASVPILSFPSIIASSTLNPSGWTRPNVGTPLGRVAAGMQIKIAKYGQEDYHAARKIRLSLGARPGWTIQDALTEIGGAAGIESAAGSAGYIEVTVPAETDPTDILGGDAVSWEDYWRQYRAGERFHVMAVLGTTPGRMLGFYLPKAVLLKPARAEVNAQAARKLRFEPAAIETGDGAHIAYQAMLCQQM